MKKNYFSVYHLKKLLMLSVVVLFAFLLILRPQNAIVACYSALMRCIKILIPSLFPFFVCAAILTKLGFAETLTKALTRIMRPLFNVPGSGALALLLGMLSGYPIGAATVADLRTKRLCSKVEGERMLAFCTNSGPVFILGSIGVGILANQRLGIFLYISHIVAALFCGIVFRFYHTSNFAEVAVVKTCHTAITPLASSIVSSIKESCVNLFFVCGFVVIFNVFVTLLILVPFGQSTSGMPALIAGLFEVTIGADLIGSLAFLSTIQKMMIISFLLGFSGVCVHFQVISLIAKTDLSAKPYLLGKVLCGIFSVGVLVLLLRFFPLPMEACIPLSPPNVFSAVSFEDTLRLSFFYIGIAAICLVILYIVSLLLSRRSS